jgi:undecaprenyl-diphosphatase
MDGIIVFCARYLIYILIAVAIGYWLTLPRKQKVQVLITGIVIGIVGLVLAKTGSALYDNPRPFVSGHVTPLFSYNADNGFPSDHTLVGSLIALAIFTVSKKWGSGLLAVAVVIGLSRVFAGVHHYVDIAGSIVFALIGLVVAVYVTPLIIRSLSERFKSPQ